MNNLSQTAFTTITLALHDYILNMLFKYESHNHSIIFLEEARKGNEAYREIMGDNHPLWVRHTAAKGVPIQ